jgi:Putative zinc-finger
MRCYDDGALRAYLDDTLPIAERDSVAEHVSACTACRGLLEEQRAMTAQVAALLAALAAAPDPRLALARFRETRDTSHESQRESVVRGPWSVVGDNTQHATRNTQHISWRSTMRTTPLWSGPRRGLLAGMAAVIVLLSLLMVPPLRAAADQLLQIFRVQKVVFVPISNERIDQLKQLNFDPQTLFATKPEFDPKPAPPHVVDSPDAASAAAGFPIRQPTAFPNAPSTTEIYVHDQRALSFQIDVASARQLLGLLGVDDVTLPDSLGAAPITANVPPAVETRYRGDGYTLMLIQGRSPSVKLPDGVDMAQLGKAALRVLGLDADQAEAMSRQIDWNSTLVVPLPSDIREVRQVQVGNAPGLLVGGEGNSPRWNLYWQEGDHVTVLQGQGRISDAEMIAAAESLR